MYKSPRLLPLDALRGSIMVWMALDHANAFIARGKLESELWSGSFPDYHGQALAFLTRFVTHLAAPGFFFLMGAGMALFSVSLSGRSWGKAQIARHFLVRGALFILLQFLLENPAWTLGAVVPPSILYFGVLYALGGAMILGTAFIFLPRKWLVGLSLLLIVLTEALLPDARGGSVYYSPLQRLWVLPGFTPGMYVLYPILPWLGVVGLGMAYGRWLSQEPEGAYNGALWLGAASLSLFVPMRMLGGFGNIRPPQGDDWIAFLNLVKYPPSLTFLSFTLGVNLSLLYLFTRLRGRARTVLEALAVFGRVPLFFYIAHLYLYALLGQWIDPQGIGIVRMIPFWLLGLAALSPLCWLYGRFKHNRPPDSLWRFL